MIQNKLSLIDKCIWNKQYINRHQQYEQYEQYEQYGQYGQHGQHKHFCCLFVSVALARATHSFSLILSLMRHRYLAIRS